MPTLEHWSGTETACCISTEESDYTIIRVFFWSEYFPPLLKTFPKALVECPYNHLHLFLYLPTIFQIYKSMINILKQQHRVLLDCHSKQGILMQLYTVTGVETSG